MPDGGGLRPKCGDEATKVGVVTRDGGGGSLASPGKPDLAEQSAARPVPRPSLSPRWRAASLQAATLDMTGPPWRIIGSGARTASPPLGAASLLILPRQI